MSMEFQLTPLLIPYLLSAAVTVWLTLYGVKIYQTGTVKNETTVAFVGIVLSVSVWTISRFFELLFVGETLTQFWLSILYIGYGGATMSALFFGLAFVGRQDILTRRNVVLLLLVPTAAVFVAATNPLHELLWAGERVTMSGWYGDIEILEREFQPLFYGYLLYTVSFALVGIYLPVRKAFSSADIYRRQAAALGFGAGIAILMGLLFAFGQQPGVPAAVDLSPVGFAIMGLAFADAIFRHRLLDLVPIARERVVESMRDGYVVFDNDDRVIDLNDEARETFGLEDAVVGVPVEEVLPRCQSVVEAHEHGTQTESEIEFDGPDGKRFFRARVSTVTEDDHPIGRLLLLNDVTEQRAVRERYRALIEDASDLILVVSPDEEIKYASPSLRDIGGVEPDDIVGTNAFELVHPEDRAEFREAFDALLDDPDGQFRKEYRSFDINGEVIHLEASVRNLVDNPFVEGIVVNAREVTGRVERERDLRAANQRLTRANEQLERFAGVISHDLRNPLNVAQGRLELARMTGDDQHFESIETSLSRMETIIQDVLTLTREGREIDDTEPVNLKDNARLAWNNVETGQAQLVVDDSITFEADRDRLLRLFENLFRNAVEHGTPAAVGGERAALKRGSTADTAATDGQAGPESPSGPSGPEGPTGPGGPGGSPGRDEPGAGAGDAGPDDREESATEVDEPPLTVTVGYDDALYVEDDGPGIPAEERDSVLEPGHTSSDDGTGLGLAIVEQIATAHGWNVAVDESDEGGARFEFGGLETVS